MQKKDAISLWHESREANYVHQRIHSQIDLVSRNTVANSLFSDMMRLDASSNTLTVWVHKVRSGLFRFEIDDMECIGLIEHYLKTEPTTL